MPCYVDELCSYSGRALVRQTGRGRQVGITSEPLVWICACAGADKRCMEAGQQGRPRPVLCMCVMQYSSNMSEVSVSRLEWCHERGGYILGPPAVVAHPPAVMAVCARDEPEPLLVVNHLKFVTSARGSRAPGQQRQSHFGAASSRSLDEGLLSVKAV